MMTRMTLSISQKIVGAEAERNFYDSQIIILDTLEKVLNSVRGEVDSWEFLKIKTFIDEKFKV